MDDFIAKNYFAKEAEFWEKLVMKASLFGRMGTTEEETNLVVYSYCNEASYISGKKFSIDGEYIYIYQSIIEI